MHWYMDRLGLAALDAITTWISNFVFITQGNIHPVITEPSRNFTKANKLQPPMTMKLFWDWKFTISVVFVMLLVEFKTIG